MAREGESVGGVSGAAEHVRGSGVWGGYEVCVESRREKKEGKGRCAIVCLLAYEQGGQVEERGKEVRQGGMWVW